VTLSQVNALLEPDRREGTRPWYLRSSGDELALDVDGSVHVDVDGFVGSIRMGRQAERDGRPAEALHAYLDAVALYRGDYLADASAYELGYLDRLRYRSDAAAAAIRAAQLLVAQGRPVEGRELAMRAAALEPLNDDAYMALARSYLAEGRPEIARSVLEQHVARLVDAGLDPVTDLFDALDRDWSTDSRATGVDG
jgi:DNA-binding SARP family transcriptional activator